MAAHNLTRPFIQPLLVLAARHAQNAAENSLQKVEGLYASSVAVRETVTQAIAASFGDIAANSSSPLPSAVGEQGCEAKEARRIEIGSSTEQCRLGPNTNKETSYLRPAKSDKKRSEPTIAEREAQIVAEIEAREKEQERVGRFLPLLFVCAAILAVKEAETTSKTEQDLKHAATKEHEETEEEKMERMIAEMELQEKEEEEREKAYAERKRKEREARAAKEAEAAVEVAQELKRQEREAEEHEDQREREKEAAKGSKGQINDNSKSREQENCARKRPEWGGLVWKGVARTSASRRRQPRRPGARGAQ